MEPTADASFAAMRERSRFGMAMAAMMRIIATTISNSINEKPFCLRILRFPLSEELGKRLLAALLPRIVASKGPTWDAATIYLSPLNSMTYNYNFGKARARLAHRC